MKAKKISFDMDDMSEISEQLVTVQNNCYTIRIRNIANTPRFKIPRAIIEELNLHAKDSCYFVQYTEGYYLSFKQIPNTSTKNYKSRKLIPAGMYDTLYLAIPQFITNIFKKINSVQLIRTKGFKKHEWQIKFLFIDYT